MSQMIIKMIGFFLLLKMTYIYPIGSNWLQPTQNYERPPLHIPAPPVRFYRSIFYFYFFNFLSVMCFSQV